MDLNKYHFFNSKLYDELVHYGKSDYYGFHMPGHKRNTEIAWMENPFVIDITEIDGFDNLHNPTGIIQDEMEYASRIYGSKKTYFLVNGSSCGNLSAISSVASAGDKIIIGRNSHKSIYNAVELLQLKVDFLYPEMIEGQDIFGGYSLKEVERILEQNRDAKALVITSPTYEGIVSDIRGICDLAHRYGIPLIVDGAHGAHFILSERFPETALSCGADIVIESLHKTLPSLTQTAVLHYNSDIVSQKNIEKYLSVYQSSSPSYVFMSSICNCIHFIESVGRERAEWLSDRIDMFHKNMSGLLHIQIMDNQYAKQFDLDASKMLILLKDKTITGKNLKDILNQKYHLEMEMAAGNYVIAMTSILDTEEGFTRLEKALYEIDRMIEEKSMQLLNEDDGWIPDSGKKNKENISIIKCDRCEGIDLQKKSLYSFRNTKVCEIYEAEKMADKLGCATTYTYLYPPGVPIVVPGELITTELHSVLEQYKMAGYEVITS